MILKSIIPLKRAWNASNRWITCVVCPLFSTVSPRLLAFIYLSIDRCTNGFNTITVTAPYSVWSGLKLLATAAAAAVSHNSRFQVISFHLMRCRSEVEGRDVVVDWVHHKTKQPDDEQRHTPPCDDFNRWYMYISACVIKTL